MYKFRFTLTALAIMAFTLFVSSTSHAQANRTWVSGVGDDVNPCSRTAPCKTFAGAIAKTAEGGEIDALDPGGFGTVNINKSMTIDGTTGQGFGSILAAGTSGVTVNVNTNPATSTVILRNLSIQGVRRCVTAGCQGLNGIRYLAGNKLVVDHVYVTGFTVNGIDASKSSSGQLIVKDSSFDDVNIGIRVTTLAGTLTATIDNCRIQGGSTGVDGLTGSSITVMNSVISHNSNFGLIAEAGTLNVTRSAINNNGTGVQASAGTTVRLADNLIYNNTGKGISNLAGAGMFTSLSNRTGGNGGGDDTPPSNIVNK
jgi:Right handed beta helix region